MIKLVVFYFQIAGGEFKDGSPSQEEKEEHEKEQQQMNETSIDPNVIPWG